MKNVNVTLTSCVYFLCCFDTFHASNVDELHDFPSYLNCRNNNVMLYILLQMEHIGINFLDLTIYKGKDRNLYTTLYYLYSLNIEKILFNENRIFYLKMYFNSPNI